jgi:hypothetical protein
VGSGLYRLPWATSSTFWGRRKKTAPIPCQRAGLTLPSGSAQPSTAWLTGSWGWPTLGPLGDLRRDVVEPHSPTPPSIATATSATRRDANPVLPLWEAACSTRLRRVKAAIKAR